ncbi:MAG: DNA polymerase III subunit epsilon [Lachnospiraceae bacterium]|nr:DNA polymerase III subunit epsilon [Lachnospiraceae bacterium]
MERNKGKRLGRYVGDYVVFDLETTGINPERDSIIEISALKVKDHRVVEEFSTLVNPGRHIPAGATAVNGITDRMVADAPDVRTAIERFVEFIGDNILVGHNIHTFDMNFAYDAAWNFLGRELGNDYVDTLYLARRYLPELSHHKLTDVAEHFQLQTQGAHRALFDCMMNQSCYEEIGRLMEARKKSGNAGWEEEITCPSCGGELVLRKGKFGMFYGCSSYPRCRFTRNVRV